MFILMICASVLCGSVNITSSEIVEMNEQTRGPDEGEYVPDELLVKFKKCVSVEKINEINKRLETHVVDILGEGRLYQLRISHSAKLEDVMKAYRELLEVEYAEYNQIVEALNIE
ncbi:MAG: hypothetical protein GY941_28255 [Planctomycetes bacterium]|nr:hypothetical protein [Planctomycetota bacterium]